MVHTTVAAQKTVNSADTAEMALNRYLLPFLTSDASHSIRLKYAGSES